MPRHHALKHATRDTEVRNPSKMFAPFKLAPLAAVACAIAVPATAAASTYNAGVLSDGPTLYWQLDEASGTIVDNAATTDGVGDGIATDGSVLGAPGAFPLSPFGAAFAGVSTIATATAIQSALAVEFWVKPTSAGSGTFLTYGNGFQLGYNNKRKLTLSVAGGATKDTRVGLPLNRWTLVDVSLNTGTGDDAQVYTNGGTWRVKTVRNVGVAPNVPAATVTLGGQVGGIDELAAFPAALTQAQAYARYTSTGLPLSTARPTIAGTPQSGQTLTATAGTWANAASTGFQWQRCDAADPATNACDDITGATSATYLAQDADLGSYLLVTESAANANGVGAVDSVAVGPVTAAPIVTPPAPIVTPPAQTIDPATGTTTNPATNTDPGTATTPPAATTPPTAVPAGCTTRLLRVPPKKVKLNRAGRLTVKVVKRRGGNVNVAIRAAKATKKRLGKVVFKLDRKTLKRTNGKLRRSFKLARLKSGKHALKLRVRPRHGKPRTIKLTLRVTGC
jgi:hypothetical protein